jgi:hypothetical protein
MMKYSPAAGDFPPNKVGPRKKKGRRLEVWRVPDIESLVDVVKRVHHFVILLFHSWSTPHITAGQLLV